MFSEYASRFLAQSQSRISNFGQPATGDDNLAGDSGSRIPSGAGDLSSRRQEWSSRGPKTYGRSFLGRGLAASGNPYQSSGGSRFGQLNFASRYSTAAPDAPLFHSRADIHEEDEDRDGDEDEDEHDREAADLYALQRSRRVFAAGRLDESSETENDHSRTSLGESQEADEEELLTGSGRRTTSSAALTRPARTTAAAMAAADDQFDDGFQRDRAQGGRGAGIRSSWNDNRGYYGSTAGGQRTEEEKGKRQTAATGFGLRRHDDSASSVHESESGHGKMVDIGLESTIADSEPPLDLTTEAPNDDYGDGAGDHPPAFQKFNPSHARFGLRRGSTNDSEQGFLSHGGGVGDADSSANLATGRDPASSSILDGAAGGPEATPSDGELFRHDPFFAWVYLIALASLFATFILVYLHTSPGNGKQPWGDTIYTTLLSSFHLLAVDTLVAVIVSLVWLAALRSFARYLVALIIVAVPVILVSFTIYPFVSSYKGGNTGSSHLQDMVMRWASIIPGAAAVVWVYLVYKGRSALKSAIEILEFSSRILAANSALVLVGMGCLALVVFWTWAWLAMFTRVFLGGSFSSKLSRFIISTSSWWLGIYFVLMYIWTLSVISGVQRGTTGATVSQWYFHRNVQPAPSSPEVVSAALHHALTTIFGSVCLSTLLALAVRLPLLVLPQRLASGLGLFFYSFIPTPIAALTNPLTLTYSAIHSQNLAMSSQGLSQLDFLSPQAPTTTLTPRAFNGGRRRRYGPGSAAPLLPYRLAKLLLHATRFIMAMALGFAGWVITARQLRISLPDGAGNSIRGSAYAYVVGLVASFIGWGVLGAMEGILSGIVDAVVICYGSETRMANGGGGYCMEAAYLFGGRRDGLGLGDDDDFRRHREVY